ncbi:MAG: 30S ribosomal protein S16 [Patescibacteria group bacterium]|jgi:small subunit ribosomal protein S16
MLAIKLSQTGKTNKKMFRLVISEKSRDPYGNVLEILGSYNPHSKELAVKSDRVKHWLSKGAQMTATVNNLLLEKKVIEGKKATASKAAKTSEKRLGQIKAKADKKAARETAPVAETTPQKEVEEKQAEESAVENA